MSIANEQTRLNAGSRVRYSEKAMKRGFKDKSERRGTIVGWRNDSAFIRWDDADKVQGLHESLLDAADR